MASGYLVGHQTAAAAQQDAAGPGAARASFFSHRLFPVIVSALAMTVGALLWLTFLPRVGTDLSAALARASWASSYPGAEYLFSWYGGFHPAGYSLLAPYVLAALGVRLAMALASVASAMLLTWLLVRHQAPRPMAAGIWAAAALWTLLSAGQAPFTLGVAAGLGCVAVTDTQRPLRMRRLTAAAALAALTCALSPVAGIFLGLAAVALVVTGRLADGIVLGVAAATPLGVMALFSDGGTQPLPPQAWLPPLIAVAAALLLIPSRWRLIRVGAAAYAAAIAIALLDPSLVGSNIERLGELLAGPLLVGLGGTGPVGAGRGTMRRWMLLPPLAATAVWQVAQPVVDLSHGNAPPYAPQTTALVRELGRLHADTARVEAVPEYGHWESQELASVVLLARGWERQLDMERNPLFYGAVLTPDAYYGWLRFNAVRYVTISAATPDFAASAETQIVRAGQPWLLPVWHNAYWQLYRVLGAPPLASRPALVVATGPAQITLRMTRAGTTIVRVRWSPQLSVSGGSVGRDGVWTSVTVPRPGLYRLT